MQAARLDPADNVHLTMTFTCWRLLQAFMEGTVMRSDISGRDGIQVIKLKVGEDAKLQRQSGPVATEAATGSGDHT